MAAQPGESLAALLRDVILELQNIEIVLNRIAKAIDGKDS